MSEEKLFDYEQLFDLLELELLPKEEDDENGWDEETLQSFEGIAVKEYYQYLFKFWPFKLEEKPEFVAGIKLLRRLLSDLGESDTSYHSGVWKTMSEIKDDWSLLQLAVPLIGHMWD